MSLQGVMISPWVVFMATTGGQARSDDSESVTLFMMSRAFAAQTVTVLYAGSLVGLMERSIGPAFKQQTGDEFRGHTGGSQELAKAVKEGALQGDVFISADPKVNALLSGPTNADRVKWYVTFAESPLVLGVSPSSRFAADAKGKSRDEVLMHSRAKIGRTDPAKDPKGALTVEFLKKADKPELAKSVLEHSSVLPEEALVKKMQTGELDVGFFYSVETTDAGLTQKFVLFLLGPTLVSKFSRISREGTVQQTLLRRS
jgi:molybdate/tungstate transport system substrate-binding protein